uniref:Sperm-tail PG-rich repeat containing 3 n=1 Tax=Sus scrofa TaxID=9823 RepID=A0A8D1ET68_PIG
TMNFDQKAVKFLANFHIYGGKHWTHGPLRQMTLLPSLRPGAAVLLSALELELVAAWGERWPPGVQELPAGPRMHMGLLSEPPPACAWTQKEPLLERRSPVGTDMDVPGPARYQGPDASIRSSFPHPYFSISRKHPPHEGGGRRAWQTMWFQSESPFTQKADFNQEQKWPSPADYQPLSPPAGPAFSFGGHPGSRTPRARALPGQLQARGVGPWAQRPLQPPPPAPRDETGPSPNSYNILPGCRLRSPSPPAFSMSRSPLLASWVGSSCTPGPTAYDVEDRYSTRFPWAPRVVIQGVRRPKRHDTGPFCTL